MIVELIPKQEHKPIFGQVFFLILSAAALAGTTIAFLILQQLINTNRTNLDILEKQLFFNTQPLEQELAAKLLIYKQNTEDFKVAASERKTFLPFLDLLEKNTHPDVFFTNLEKGESADTFVLDGQTRNFFTLEQQRLVWKQQKQFENVQLTNIALGESETASFNVEFTVIPELLTPSR